MFIFVMLPCHHLHCKCAMVSAEGFSFQQRFKVEFLSVLQFPQSIFYNLNKSNKLFSVYLVFHVCKLPCSLLPLSLNWLSFLCWVLLFSAVSRPTALGGSTSKAPFAVWHTKCLFKFCLGNLGVTNHFHAGSFFTSKLLIYIHWSIYAAVQLGFDRKHWQTGGAEFSWVRDAGLHRK